jgi:hypothetical protein
MPGINKPIKRVWKPRVPSEKSRIKQFDNHGNELPLLNVLEKNTDSVWATYESLQAAEAKKVAMLTRKQVSSDKLSQESDPNADACCGPLQQAIVPSTPQ